MLGTVLITGIHGFVGSNLVKALAKNYTLYGLDIIASEKAGVVKTYSWQELDEAIIPPVDAIIHLAGKAHDTHNKSIAQTYFDINTGLTQKIFDYFTAHSKIQQFIFFSSVKAAVDKVVGNILTEEVATSPVGPYGESKVKAEEYLQMKMSAYPKLYANRQIVILRPCMIHGPGNKGNLNLLYNVVSKHIPWPLGAFDNRRTFTSIDNLNFVIHQLLEKNVPNGIYNMSDDEALSTNELISIICKVLGRKTYIWRIPKILIIGCAKVGNRLHLPLNTLRLNKLTENYVVSNVKIKKALGIEAMPVRAQDGLIKTIHSFKATK